MEEEEPRPAQPLVNKKRPRVEDNCDEDERPQEWRRIEESPLPSSAEDNLEEYDMFIVSLESFLEEEARIAGARFVEGIHTKEEAVSLELTLSCGKYQVSAVVGVADGNGDAYAESPVQMTNIDNACDDGSYALERLMTEELSEYEGPMTGNANDLDDILTEESFTFSSADHQSPEMGVADVDVCPWNWRLFPQSSSSIASRHH